MALSSSERLSGNRSNYDIASSTSAKEEEHGAFTPKGAIAFFALLILMYTVMWFSIYLELINRI